MTVAPPGSERCARCGHREFSHMSEDVNGVLTGTVVCAPNNDPENANCDCPAFVPSEARE